MKNKTNVHISSAEPKDYIALMKTRVMRLAIFTALVGLMLAPVNVEPVIAVIAIIAIATGAGAAGALNMWYDADIDTKMSRTKNRPVAAKKITPDEALCFGMFLAIFSVLTLGLIANWVAAALLAFTIFFYVVIYTIYLKRTTPQNIVIGGAAGALPPVIGYAVATNSVTPESVALFLIIFLWTPPHFWALAMFRVNDYQAANIPMMPNVIGNKKTANLMLMYSASLLPAGVLISVLGTASYIFAIIASVLAAIFIALTWDVKMKPDDTKKTRRLFGFSIFYLFAVFACLLVEAIYSKVVA